MSSVTLKLTSSLLAIQFSETDREATFRFPFFSAVCAADGVTYPDHRRLRQLVMREYVQMIGTIAGVVEIRAFYSPLFLHLFRTGFHGGAKAPQDRGFQACRVQLISRSGHQNVGKTALA